MPSHSPELDVNVVVSRMPSGVVTTRLGGTVVSSPVKQSARATNLSIVKTVSELPAATITHSGGCSELLNRPPITELGRYGLDDWGVGGWVRLLDLGVNFWDAVPGVFLDEVPGVEVVDWVWPGDLGVAVESGALVESDGAG